MYAGQLCSTQLGGRIDLDDQPFALDTEVMICVIHGGSTRLAHVRERGRLDTVKVVLRHPATGAQSQHVIASTDVVRVEDPS